LPMVVSASGRNVVPGATPAYNSEKTIAEGISAVRNLDRDGEVEVIVVNSYTL